MTPEEALLIRAHREYWTPRVENPNCGGDGASRRSWGAYGVAIIEAASAGALEAMQAADPVVAARCGFFYENCPMPSIAVRPSMPLSPIASVTP